MATAPICRVLVASVASLAAVQQPEPKTGIVEMRTMFVTSAGHGQRSEVTYAIASVPADAIGAEVQIRRDAEVIARYPVPLVAGTGRVQIPAGLPLDFPAPDLLIELETSPGTFTVIDDVRIDTPEEAARKRAIAAMQVDTVSPDLIEQGSGPVTVTLGGSGLTIVATLSVDLFDLTPTIVGGVMKLELPADLLVEPGFLRIRGANDNAQAAAVAVADRALAHAGVLTGPRIASAAVRWDEHRGSYWLTVTGEGFEPGMSLAIGRGDRLVTRLETEVTSSSAMDGKIVWQASGQQPDFFLAVLSADGTKATRPFPVTSPDALLDAYLREFPVPPIQGPDAYLVHGSLLWNRKEPQGFHLEGRLVRPGVRVRLRRDEGSDDDSAIVVTEAAPPGTAGATRPVVHVPVPATLTTRPEYTVALAILSK